MTQKEAKTPSESAMETWHYVMPEHVNPKGHLFGGTMVSWIDIIAAMVAQRHCGVVAVTASIDTIVFASPVVLADHVRLQASVNYVGRTSLEVGVKVSVENPLTGVNRKSTHAYLTFVALDEHGKPTPVPQLTPETADEKRRWDNAKKRVQHRKELLGNLEPGA